MLWRCEKSRHITSPPLLWVHQRHPTRSESDCSKYSNGMIPLSTTMYVYGTHIFNLSAIAGTIILSSSRGVQGACSSCCFAIALARR